MMTLVVGGAASGKSAYAESLIAQTHGMPRIYLATMQPFDEECRARIAKHRSMRANKQFTTMECYTDLSTVHLQQHGAVLLECMSNLAANELFQPNATARQALQSIVGGIELLHEQCDTLVIVSNEVFSGGDRYAGDTQTYLHLLAAVNQALAQHADNVCEVVCGISQYYKGKEPAE